MPILTDQERCGTLIGGVYRLESILGRGGMGVVFRARDEEKKRPVAVKILRPELAMQHATFTKRFVREARAAAAVRHPNVVEVYDVGAEPDGTAFQVLALLEGETLREHLARKKTLSVAMVLDLLLPVMHALEAAHAASIVHRDLKPDNIFLSRQPNGDVVPTLLDFGIAKLLEGHESFATNTGSILGTPSYMAPEQATGARGQGLGIDVWAMGIIIYECLSGAPPFTGTSPPHVMLKIMTENPIPLDEKVPEVPRGVAEVVAQALNRDLKERFQSMSAFRDALRLAAEEASIAVPEVGRVSTTTVMSIAPPPSNDSIDLSIALDSEDRRPRVWEEAATVAASAVRSAPVAVPIAQALEPARPRSPLLFAAMGGALALVLAGVVVWLTNQNHEPVEVAVVAAPTPIPAPTPVPAVVIAPTPVVEVAAPETTTVVTTTTPEPRTNRHARVRHTTSTEPAATPVEPTPTVEAEPTSMRRTGSSLPGVVEW